VTVEPIEAVVDDDEAHQWLQALAGEISEQGALRSPPWRRVFTRVRRHVFLPRYLHDEEPGSIPARWRLVEGSNPNDHDEWLSSVYSDTTLIVDLKGQPIPPERGGGSHPIVTSSSTMPSLMMRMLEDLDIHDGQRVLEIGTGTGYNAALLSERLGDTHVTSVDIDPELVATAGRRLAAHGYRPHLVAADGVAGVSEQAPYDRIIATCSVERIPYAWVAQTRPGGRIMVNLRGPLMSSALALLTVHPDGTASGPFLPDGAIFMPLRHDPSRPYDYTVRITPPDTHPTRGRTSLDPSSLHQHAAWGFFAQTSLPDAAFRLVITGDEETSLGTEIATPDHSWALIGHEPRDGGYPTSQAGPRRLVELLEGAHHRWSALDQPRWDAFGITVTPTSQWVFNQGPGRGQPSCAARRGAAS
jgi:methyltransferase of ATP-grasp peptide maturase system